MENKAHALAAGVFVVVTAILLLLLAAWLTRDTARYEIYEISTRESVTGLQAQAPVRYRGVDVGKVQAIDFDPRSPGKVLVRLAVQPRAPVTRETYATLGYQGVTGLAYVQLDDSGRAAPPLVGQAGAPPRIPLRPGLVSRLGDRSEDILYQVEQITGKLNQLLADANQQRLVALVESVERAADGIGRLSNQAAAILNAQLGSQRVSIPEAVGDLSAAADALRQTATRASAALAPLGQAAETFNATTLPRINQMAEEATQAARRLQGAAAGLQENPQGLIFGPSRPPPGPGERGFMPPKGKP